MKLPFSNSLGVVCTGSCTDNSLLIVFPQEPLNELTGVLIL